MNLGFAIGIGHELDNGIAYFSSAVIDSTDNKFTIFWAGKKFANDSKIACNIGGVNAGTAGVAAFAVSAGSSNWTVVDASGSHILGSVVPRPEGQDAPVHHVDIDYFPGTGTFTVEVKQFNAATLSHSGNVFATTKAQIQSTQRIGLWCLKTSEDASFVNVAYLIDGVVMREK